MLCWVCIEEPRTRKNKREGRIREKEELDTYTVHTQRILQSPHDPAIFDERGQPLAATI